jgi:hypothetical protein
MEISSEKKSLLSHQQEIYRKKELIVASTRNISEVQFILTELLYVPDERLKLVLVLELVDYLTEKFSKQDYKIRLSYATQNGILTGFVICQIDGDYKSYGMPCPTFGWLHCRDLETCRALMSECEKFVRENKKRKLRGPINYPKSIGGIGFQTEGFEAPMMSGVAFGDPKSKVLEYLQQLGYKKDSKYLCLDTFLKKWARGKDLDKNIAIRFLPLNEISDLKEQIMALASQSLYAVLADAPGGKARFEEMIDGYAQACKVLKLVNKELPQDYADVPGFRETWESCDLKEIVPMSVYAFDRNTNELVGVIMCQPNLFQLWNGESLTHLNVDTAMIKKEYAGRGIFSALHNIGVFLSSSAYGFNYYEGTTIWGNNDRAIKTIFPHGIPVRTHYVVQKRLLKKN